MTSPAEHFPEPAPATGDASRGLMITRVEPQSKQAFRAKAAAKGMSQSQAMREAFRDWMAKP